MTASIENLGSTGLNIDPVEVGPGLVPEFLREGASRYRRPFENGTYLDALLLDKGADTLIVTFHGALARGKYMLPRFERLATLRNLPVNSLFFGDPALMISDQLELAWFTGWEGIDLHAVIADWVKSAADQLGCSQVILSGSSGGGFAALQISALVEGSVAVVFNPQTRIDRYYVKGNPRNLAAQRRYVEIVHPELLGSGGVVDFDFSPGWAAQLGESASVIRRYEGGFSNYVLYCTSPSDFHHEQHYRPFMEAVKAAGGSGRVESYIYDDFVGHNPPKVKTYLAALERGIEISVNGGIDAEGQIASG